MMEKFVDSATVRMGEMWKCFAKVTKREVVGT